MINVTKTFLPPIEEYNAYLRKLWESGWITNQGKMVQELEVRMKERLEVEYLQFVSNGTIAIQLAIKALELKGEVITTPFSYVATTTSLIWEHCTPVFTDIEDKTFCLDPAKIEAAITNKTSAILATHVYGYPCDVDKIAAIAKKYKLKVIYDGAHAFGVRKGGRSLMSFGDITTLSLHATKLFHTVEGGAVICNDSEIDKKVCLYRSFGHVGDDYFTMGINGKNSEFHAAMGLCNLPYVDAIITRRRELSEYYDKKLSALGLQFPVKSPDLHYNYAYYPVIFSSEAAMLASRKVLLENNISTRRYFYPSLNTLPYLKADKCEVSEDIARRVLCLPLYPQLTFQEADQVISHITNK